jgi:hypothetical protein
MTSLLTLQADSFPAGKLCSETAQERNGRYIFSVFDTFACVELQFALGAICDEDWEFERLSTTQINHIP